MTTKTSTEGKEATMPSNSVFDSVLKHEGELVDIETDDGHVTRCTIKSVCSTVLVAELSIPPAMNGHPKVEIPLDNIVECAGDPDLEADRGFVVNCLHWHGVHFARVPKNVANKAYTLADGYGDFSQDPEGLRGINDGWDWSHIRDSSPNGIRCMAEYLRKEMAETLRQGTQGAQA